MLWAGSSAPAGGCRRRAGGDGDRCWRWAGDSGPLSGGLTAAEVLPGDLEGERAAGGTCGDPRPRSLREAPCGDHISSTALPRTFHAVPARRPIASWEAAILRPRVMRQ
jgi:hypothetical protein